MSNIHTLHHHKQDDGRSPEIESYIDKTVDWINDHLSYETVLDMGCDNGYMLSRFSELGKEAEGLDFFENPNIFNQTIHLEDMCDPELPIKLNKMYDLVSFNHTLEHVFNPEKAMSNAADIGKHVFLGLPKAGHEWAYWDGHVSIWDETWAETFMKRNGFELIANKYDICFRGDNVEFWQLYKNTTK